MKDEIKELTTADFERGIPRRRRDRLVRGDFKRGEDVAALRCFTGLSQETFALALGISVHTLRNWEQGRRMPEAPALASLVLDAGKTSAEGCVELGVSCATLRLRGVPDASRGTVKLATCEPRPERTPEAVETNLIELG